MVAGEEKPLQNVLGLDEGLRLPSCANKSTTTTSNYSANIALIAGERRTLSIETKVNATNEACVVGRGDSYLEYVLVLRLVWWLEC